MIDLLGRTFDKGCSTKDVKQRALDRGYMDHIIGILGRIDCEGILHKGY